MTVLGTHAWIWWTSDPSRLGRAARRALEDAKRVVVPAICCAEVACPVGPDDLEVLVLMEERLGARLTVGVSEVPVRA